MQTTPPLDASSPSAQVPQEEVPTLEAVDRIVVLSDPVLRNLQITQAYCELSQALGQWLGRAANWCTYATWASKQAGVTIRQEDLRRLFERLLEGSSEVSEAWDRADAYLARLGGRRQRATMRPPIHQLVDPRQIFARTSEAVAYGNLKVFAEIGRELARFLAAFRDDTTFDAEKIARYCDALRPGDPPEGQEYLRRALTHLFRARFEDRPAAKAELLLLANLEIGYHEQTRLQPEITAALDAPLLDPDQLKARLLEIFLPHRGLFLRLRLFITRLFGRKSPLDHAAERLAVRLRAIAHRVITECLMTLAFPPDLVLRLGQDVPLDFPMPFRQLSNQELLALLARLDPTPDSPRESGADDWSDLADRMHFIADLFRAYHDYPHLYDVAFTPAQVLAIKAGHMPEGPL
jgi:hypothetical protein